MFDGYQVTFIDYSQRLKCLILGLSYLFIVRSLDLNVRLVLKVLKCYAFCLRGFGLLCII